MLIVVRLAKREANVRNEESRETKNRKSKNRRRLLLLPRGCSKEQEVAKRKSKNERG